MSLALDMPSISRVSHVVLPAGKCVTSVFVLFELVASLFFFSWSEHEIFGIELLTALSCFMSSALDIQSISRVSHVVLPVRESVTPVFVLFELISSLFFF